MVTENSLNWCSLSLHEVINKSFRLDASAFDVEAKKAWDKVKSYSNGYLFLKSNNNSSSLVDDAYYPGRFKRIYIERGGEEFFLPSQINDIYPKAEKRISKLTKCDISELRLKKNTLLLTRSGTIGNIGYVSASLENKVFSDDVIRITFKHDYDLGYSYAFLKSEIGNKILQTNGYGSVITHLEPEHLNEIIIPNAPIEIRKAINALIVSSYDLRDKSNVLIDHATELLISELKLPKEDELLNNNKFSFSVPLSKLNYRLDGSFHLPLADHIVNVLKKSSAELLTLSDSKLSSNIILTPRFKRVYVEKNRGRVLFGGKQLYELDPSNKKYLSFKKHDKMYHEQLAIKENTILITRSGTIGKVVLTPKHWKDWVASDHIIRVIPATNELAGYLYIFLSSIYGYYLITKHTYGSVIDEIDDHHVGEIPIPLLKNKVIQQKINSLALQANELRYQAYCKEQEALDILNKDVLGI